MTSRRTRIMLRVVGRISEPCDQLGRRDGRVPNRLWHCRRHGCEPSGFLRTNGACDARAGDQLPSRRTHDLAERVFSSGRIRQPRPPAVAFRLSSGTHASDVGGPLGREPMADLGHDDDREICDGQISLPSRHDGAGARRDSHSFTLEAMRSRGQKVVPEDRSPRSHPGQRRPSDVAMGLASMHSSWQAARPIDSGGWMCRPRSAPYRETGPSGSVLKPIPTASCWARQKGPRPRRSCTATRSRWTPGRYSTWQ